jgi:CHAT domain-containing protein
MKRIVAVLANPKGTNPLRLGEELRVIQQCVERSRRRAHIRLDSRHAATIDDLARALLEGNYAIVHLSGHGGGNGFVLEDDRGLPFVPPPAALAKLFHDYSPPIEFVILNSCYSLTEGVFTALGVPYTIASERPLDDSVAIEFTRGFYDAVGMVRNMKASYDEGVRRCLLKGCDPRRLPTILVKDEVRRWPREKLPIGLEDGRVVLPDEIVREGFCSCERTACVDASDKVYCYWTKDNSRWVITKRMYWRCYDEGIPCPRCRRRHKRGHVGRRGRCARPYAHQILQSD